MRDTLEESGSVLDQLRSRLLHGVAQHSPRAGLEMIRRALEISESAHACQSRDDGAPYILHPLRVTLFLLEEAGIHDAELLCAALLHDVSEDHAQFTTCFLVNECGARVGEIVRILTKPRGKTRDAVNRVYFRRLEHATEDVKIIKLADKLDNVRDAVNCSLLPKRRRTAVEARDFYRPLASGLQDPRMRRVLLDHLDQALTVLLASDPEEENDPLHD